MQPKITKFSNKMAIFIERPNALSNVISMFCVHRQRVYRQEECNCPLMNIHFYISFFFTLLSPRATAEECLESVYFNEQPLRESEYS